MLEQFEDWQLQDAMEVQQRVAEYDPTTGKVTSQSNWVAIDGLTAIPIWFYRDRAARAFVDGKFKEQVSAVALVDPRELGGVTLTAKMRGVIDGKAWRFLEPDDVMGFGEMVVIGLNGEENGQ